ncbi:MAG: FAD-binding oxidoreductase [Promethearchaeota archaeon]
MVLNQEIYSEFESVVGPKNINGGEVITEAYAYNWCMELINYMDGKEPIPYSPRPKAVLLPSTTEEVQRIIQLCNKYGMQFKAQSTGLGPWNNVSTDNCVILDLRRMNKIVKIDEKNLYAVIEPYVSGSQLQVEIMKYGLNCHMPGAGPQVSPLASATSMNGPGFTSPCTGHSSRNVLGVEWVLPDGEIMKLGSYGLKNNPDWYMGDGPGPSLRGIMRGWAGAKSGIGVFTKVAVKLFPYPCKTDFNINGHSPNYGFKIPDYMRLYVMDCRTHKNLEKVMLSIEKEEISFMCSFLAGFAVMAIFANSIEKLMDLMAIGTMQVPIVTIIAARTKREFDYKQKVMDYVIQKHKLENIIGTKYIPEPIFYAEALRSNLGQHGFIATGGFQSNKGVCDTAKICLRSAKMNIPLKKEFIKMEALPNDFGEGQWMSSYEGGHYFHMEIPTMFDQTKEHSVKGMAKYLERSNELDLVKHLGAPFFVEGDKMHDMYGPHTSNYHLWLRKIKTAFDPNNIADSGFYISPETSDKIEK